MVAAAVRNDPDHGACAHLLRENAGSLIVPAVVLVEAGYLIAKALGPSGEAALLRTAATGALRVEPLGIEDLERMAALVEQYADLPLGTVDAAIVATAERLAIDTIATLDRRHFSVVRPLHVASFSLVPE